MPIPFLHFCDLLEAIQKFEQKYQKNHLRKRDIIRRNIDEWFDVTRLISDIGRNSETLVAVLSTLLPELRPDRIYGLKEDGLARVVLRCLHMDPKRSTRAKQLTEWRAKNDLGVAVQCLLEQAENPRAAQVITIEDFNTTLDKLAGRSRFSSSAIRYRASQTEDWPETKAVAILKDLYGRATSKEAKWLTYCILKRFPGDIAPARTVLYAYHFVLPHIHSHQNDLKKACALICQLQEQEPMPHRPDDLNKRDEYLHSPSVLQFLKPEVGCQIERQEFIKARSLSHVCDLTRGRNFSVERKYDGEYCQIHIDLTLPLKEQIKITSKKGRDSTWDRKGIHSTIRRVLRLDLPREERTFDEHLILAAEMVVYNDAEGEIKPFHHIRSHVNRAGTFIGTDNDTPRDQDSHLMLAVFDVLLIDEESFVHRPFRVRRVRLQKVIPEKNQVTGYCEVVESTFINFGTENCLKAKEQLTAYFAKAISERWEGIVLKPRCSPFIDLSYKADKNARGYGFVGGKNAWIKLKKDYIDGLADSGDFCIVGGTTERGTGARQGKAPRSAGLKQELTIFHAAVVVNKDSLVYGEKPKLRVLFEVGYNITQEDLVYIQRHAYFKGEKHQNQKAMPNYDLEYPPELNVTKLDTIFNTPLVFEVFGDRYERQTNCGFWTIGKPRVGKIHWDREFTDCLGYEELQDMAEYVIRGPDMTSQQEREWVRRLLATCPPKKLAKEKQTPKEKQPPNIIQGKLKVKSGTTPPDELPPKTAPLLTPVPSSGIEVPESSRTRQTMTRDVEMSDWQPPLLTPAPSSAIPTSSPSSGESSRKRKAMETCTPSQTNERANAIPSVDLRSTPSKRSRASSKPTDATASQVSLYGGSTTQSDTASHHSYLHAASSSFPMRSSSIYNFYEASSTASYSPSTQLPDRTPPRAPCYETSTTESNTASKRSTPKTSIAIPYPNASSEQPHPVHDSPTQCSSHHSKSQASTTVSDAPSVQLLDVVPCSIPSREGSTTKSYRDMTLNYSAPKTDIIMSYSDKTSVQVPPAHATSPQSSPNHTKSQPFTTASSAPSTQLAALPGLFSTTQQQSAPSDCPLTSADIFLPKTFFKFPQLFELLSAHDVYMFHELALPPSQPTLEGSGKDTTSKDTTRRRKIVIVDSRRNTLTKRIVAQVVAWHKAQIQSGVREDLARVEVYDWRVTETGKFAERYREGRVQWDLWKVWEV